MMDALKKRNLLFEDFFASAPRSSLDLPLLRKAWLALRAPYEVHRWMLPLPVWRHRQYEDNGQQAWKTLKQQLDGETDLRPFCIYLHLPFCSSKCHFCDCYSFKLGSHIERNMQRYVEALCCEMSLWSSQGSLSRRPVSTVHMGGGTPSFIGPDLLRRLVDHCRTNFNITEDTEWALESTVESLHPQMVDTMQELGFRRLHVGVQTLQDPVRTTVGRHCKAKEVLVKIADLRSLGWIISVDLVCGLPGQTLDNWMDGLLALHDVGVNGFSLYELLIYPQNRRWAQSQGLIHNDRHIKNFFLFQSGAHWLEDHGYHKNLFNHWVDELDQNIYFTFPTRGEDCLAIGTIADGVFGDYHFRHPAYAQYLRSSSDRAPGLEGGLRRTSKENNLLPLITDILSGIVSSTTITVIDCSTNGRSLLQSWHAAGLVRKNENDELELTSSGSWFAGNIVEDLQQLME